MAQTAPKVIKIVNLKRFMPEAAPEVSELKRTRQGLGFSSFNPELSNTYETIDNTYQDNEHMEKECIIQNSGENTNEVQNPESYYIMHVPSRSKIKFRNCSHTPEELSTLHEHRDDTLVKVGDIFDTRDAFKEYLNDNAKKWHYYYVCRNSKKKIIEYNCICMAYNIKEREVVIRRQKKRTTACPCKIRLTIEQTMDKLIVYYVCNHHDHPTTASAFYHYPHAKYLPQNVKEEFLDLTYLGLDVELIQKYIHSVVGLTIKKKDIWSYAYRFKKRIFKRSISDERHEYIEGLMIKIRETYGESCDIAEIDRPSKQSELVESINENETKRKGLHVNVENDNIIIGNMTEEGINYSEDSLLKEVLEDSNIDNTEIIVQYVNDDGILCDENGVPVTNSSAIIQFINNYTYVTSDNELEETVFSELVDSERTHEVYPIDWEYLRNNSAIENSVMFESEPFVEDSEDAVLNDAAAESYKSECLEQGAVVNEIHMKRLSPTPASEALYAEMDNFRKYYYVDHRYIALDQDSREPTGVWDEAVHHGNRTNTTNSFRGPNQEEYIKAPDFVCQPIPIRHCYGHDDFTLLTDPEALWPGAKFLTHEVFLSYINERAGRWFFYYSLVESGKSPENYVYKCVYGKSRVSKNAYRAKGLRKRTKLTTQCPCQIRLRRLEAAPAYLTVLYSCNHHDHALDEHQFVAQPHSRRLPGHVKEEIKDLITLRVSFDVIRKYVAAETGVRVYGKYFHNVRSSMRARGECRRYTEQRLAVLTAKIRDLEATYGNAAKENPEANIFQNHTKKRMLPLQVQTEDRSTQAGLDDAGTQDTLPTEDTAKQSRLETRLQNISHKEILMKVKKLQEAVRSDGVRSDVF